MMLLEHRPLLLLHTFLIKTRLAKTGQELGEEFLFSYSFCNTVVQVGGLIVSMTFMFSS